MAVYGLRRLQLGKQTTYDTAVAATVLLRGVTDVSAQLLQTDSVIEEVGVVGPSSLGLLGVRHAQATVELQTTYQHVLYGLAGLFGVPTPTGTGPYTWTFAAPNTAVPNAQVYSLEYGMSGAEYRVTGAVIKTWTLSHVAGESVTESWEMIAHSIVPQAMTSLATPTVDAVSAIHAGLWIDDTSTAHGTTQINATLIEAELSVETNRHVKLFESQNPKAWGEGRWETNLRLLLEWNASSKALVDALANGNSVDRHIRLRWQQSTSRSLTVDFAGRLTSEPELFGDRDGNATVELEFNGLYTSQFGNYLQFEVINDLGSLA